MNRDMAQLLAPHAAHLHSLLGAARPSPALIVVILLLALCITAAVAVKVEGSR